MITAAGTHGPAGRPAAPKNCFTESSGPDDGSCRQLPALAVDSALVVPITALMMSSASSSNAAMDGSSLEAAEPAEAVVMRPP